MIITQGISMKTQILYCIVFSCRYVDLFWNFWSMYNSIIKVVFILSSYTIVYFMKFKNPICKTYDAASDNFKIWILTVPCFMIALFWNVTFTPFEILWAFSIYLEVELYALCSHPLTSAFIQTISPSLYCLN